VTIPASFSAFTATTTDDGVARGVVQLEAADLPTDGVLIDVSWSSVNYKDGLATIPKGGVARISPLVPGIDMAGTVVESDDPAFSPGDEVIAHGYELGVSRHGGYAEYQRVPAGWLVPLPAGLSLREAMVIGTAGYTAACSVLALERHGIAPGSGPVLVTGASGGVGSTAVSMLAGLGHEVVASTGKGAEGEAFLKELGASSVIPRAELSEPGRSLQKEIYVGGVDCVGSTTLVNALAQTRYGGAVAASGLTQGSDLPGTVLPFILRGVSLLGIDSVQTPIDHRREVWRRLASDLKPAGLETIATAVTLEELEPVLAGILEGSVHGRTIVDLRRS
jgi:putative YhdH/YhfP family quinone oxidoreductase